MSVQQPVLSSCPPTNVRVASLLPGQEGVAVHAVNREYGRASTPSMLRQADVGDAQFGR